MVIFPLKGQFRILHSFRTFFDNCYSSQKELYAFLIFHCTNKIHPKFLLNRLLSQHIYSSDCQDCLFVNLFRPLNLAIPNSLRSVLNLQKMNKSQTKKEKRVLLPAYTVHRNEFSKIVIPSAFSLFLIKIKFLMLK